MMEIFCKWIILKDFKLSQLKIIKKKYLLLLYIQFSLIGLIFYPNVYFRNKIEFENLNLNSINNQEIEFNHRLSLNPSLESGNISEHSGDLFINSGEIFTIYSGIYKQQGNIFLSSGAAIIVLGGTIELQQDYHEQYIIEMNGNSSFTVKNNSIITSSHRFLMIVKDESKISVENSIMCNPSTEEGAVITIYHNATLKANNSKFDMVATGWDYNPNYLYNASLNLQNCFLRQFSPSFTGNSNVTISNLQEGNNINSNLNGLLCNCSFSYNLINVNINPNGLTMDVRDKATVKLINSNFFQVSPSDQSIVIIEEDSTIYQIVPRFENINGLFSLKIGQLWNYSFDLSFQNSFKIICNGGIIKEWVCRPGLNTNIIFFDSNIEIMRPNTNANLTFINCSISRLWLWPGGNGFRGFLHFSNTNVSTTYIALESQSGFWSNITITGNVTFLDTQIYDLGDIGWNNITIWREYQISTNLVFSEQNPLHLIIKNNLNIIFQKNIRYNSDLSFWMIYTKENYLNVYDIELFFENNLIFTRNFSLLSSTPFVYINAETNIIAGYSWGVFILSGILALVFIRKKKLVN